MVANTEALQTVTSGPDGILAGLSNGKIYVDMSTVSPAASRELATQVEAKGAQMLDAPVSGSSITLEEGKLSFMVGGKRETFERAYRISKPSAQSHLCRRPWLSGLDENCDQLEPSRADAGFQRRCAAGRKERHRPGNRSRSSAQ